MRSVRDMSPTDLRRADTANELRRLLDGIGQVMMPSEADEPILSAPVRAAVFGWMTEINAADELSDVGLMPRRSALLCGPPGCGKTTLAHHLAARLGVPMVSIGAENLFDSYLGASERNASKLFDALATYEHPVVLFLDEFDAIGSKRTTAGGDRGGAQNARNSMVTVLLRKIEAFQGTMIAATNRGDNLDPALWRRFGMQIEIGLPDEESRWAILKRYSLPYDLADEFLDALGHLTVGAPPSLLRQLMEGVKRQIILGARLRSIATDLADAVAQAAAQLQPHPDYELPELWARPLASATALRNATDTAPWPPTRDAGSRP